MAAHATAPGVPWTGEPGRGSCRVCIVTAGHLSTCPRMVKAADALAARGYRVRVVSTRHTEWATAADRDLRRSREGRWTWTVVDYRRRAARWRYAVTGVRHRAARAAVRWLTAARVPGDVVAGAYSRAHVELVRAALAAPADLFYGGTSGALAAVAAAARRAGVPYALDLEDLHTAEPDATPGGAAERALAEPVERAVLPGAALLTAASGPITAAYRARYGVAPIAIHNTFPLPAAPPDLAPRSGGGLRLYWFSQTIGPNGEHAVRAMGRAALSGELHLRGARRASYLDGLRKLAGEIAPGLRVVDHPPALPDDMVDLCAPFDVGLSLERADVAHRDVCLTNKVFTYMLAGLPVVLTATSAQGPLAADLDEGALLYAPGDVDTLAKGLRRWAEDKAHLGRARQASWAAARRRWHWEHPEERGALLAAVARALGVDDGAHRHHG